MRHIIWRARGEQPLSRRLLDEDDVSIREVSHSDSPDTSDLSEPSVSSDVGGSMPLESSAREPHYSAPSLPNVSGVRRGSLSEPSESSNVRGSRPPESSAREPHYSAPSLSNVSEMRRGSLSEPSQSSNVRGSRPPETSASEPHYSAPSLSNVFEERHASLSEPSQSSNVRGSRSPESSAREPHHSAPSMSNNSEIRPPFTAETADRLDVWEQFAASVLEDESEGSDGDDEEDIEQHPQNAMLGDRLPSIGSSRHASGDCTPCLYIRSGMSCPFGINCTSCHLHNGMVRNPPQCPRRKLRPCKGKRARFRKLIAKIEDLVQQNPYHFQLETDVDLPPHIKENPDLKQKLDLRVQGLIEKACAEREGRIL